MAHNLLSSRLEFSSSEDGRGRGRPPLQGRAPGGASSHGEQLRALGYEPRPPGGSLFQDRLRRAEELVASRRSARSPKIPSLRSLERVPKSASDDRVERAVGRGGGGNGFGGRGGLASNAPRPAAGRGRTSALASSISPTTITTTTTPQHTPEILQQPSISSMHPGGPARGRGGRRRGRGSNSSQQRQHFAGDFSQQYAADEAPPNYTHRQQQQDAVYNNHSILLPSAAHNGAPGLHRQPSTPNTPLSHPPFQNSHSHQNPTRNPTQPSSHPTQSNQGYFNIMTPSSNPNNAGRRPQNKNSNSNTRSVTSRTQPLLLDSRWKKIPEIGFQIGPGLKTDLIHDLYIALQDFGDVERIEISKNNQNVHEGTARVYMRKIKTPFWLRGTLRVAYGDDGDKFQMVPIEMVESKRTWMVRSPLNPTKLFNETYSFPYTELDFGFMIEPETMMIMHTATASPEPDPTSFEIDFRTKQLKIYFTVYFPNKAPPAPIYSGPDIAEDPNRKKMGCTELYRLEVPFMHLGHLVMAGENDYARKKTIVIPLSSPPRYGRRLHDKTMGMDDESNYWTSNEAWMRQVSIVHDRKGIRDQPIGLRYKDRIIDIGRWTTFRLTLDLNTDELVRNFDQMLDAIMDYNVETRKFTADEFKVSFDCESLVPIWDYLDGTTSSEPAAQDNGYFADLEEFIKPTLPYTVRYQLEVCVSHELLNEFNLTPAFIDRLITMPTNDALALLEHVAEKKVRYYKPMEIFEIPRREIRPALDSRKLPEYCALMRRATITPGGLILGTPSVETTNRVMRHYSALGTHFIRISFSDEKFFGRINGTEKMTLNEVFSRVYSALKAGVTIGGRTFEFLAFGNSQLREHGAYFFAPTPQVCAEDIRQWMGEFGDIRIVAKCASRLGQCFSTTRALKGAIFEKREIPDLEFNGHCFSDGVGKITPLLAHMISWELKVDDASCFQFRLGGNKGVLTVDPTMEYAKTSRAIQTRPSQRKFECHHIGLEIVRCSQFASASLNRQLIILMSTLGVPDAVFESRLRLILSDYHLALGNPNKALELLTKHIDPNQMTLQIAQLVRDGFMDIRDPFVMSLMHLWRSWTIKYLKEKAKISIDKGAFVLGVVDETGDLKGYYDSDDLKTDLPEIFLQISDASHLPNFTEEGNLTANKQKRRIITGPVIVARNPSLHPGDVRLVMAVDKPSLRHLVDVVVFPHTGDRPIPSMLSGGDLDGDDYIVLWDTDFTDYIENQIPASYTAAKTVHLDRPVEISDIASFFVNYMKNDCLGTIANNHLAWADKLWDGVKSRQCLELAQLHSDAVDYPKSGTPARMEKRLRCSRYPHFMEKDADRSYHSDKILGRLYDMVEKVDFVPCYQYPFSKAIMNAYDVSNEIIQEMTAVKDDYDAAVRRILAQYDIKTEMEIWSTFTLSHSGGRDYMFHEELGRIAGTLKERFRKIVIEKAGGERQVTLPPYVAAMYIVTAQQVERAKLDLWKKQAARRKNKTGVEAKELVIGKADVERFPFMSFPWMFPEVLCKILRMNRNVGVDGVREMTNDEWEGIMFEVLEPDGTGGLQNLEVEVEELDDEGENEEDEEEDATDNAEAWSPEEGDEQEANSYEGDDLDDLGLEDLKISEERLTSQYANRNDSELIDF